MVNSLLDKGKFDKILEIGYGSGIFLLELSKKSRRLYGVDIHHKIPLVKEMMRKEGIDADLWVGDISHLPFKDEMFD